MPVVSTKALAKKAGVSLDKAEEYWEKAKKIAKEELDLPYNEDKWDDDAWAYVMGIVKKMMKVNEGNLIKSFSQYLSEKGCLKRP